VGRGYRRHDDDAGGDRSLPHEIDPHAGPHWRQLLKFGALECVSNAVVAADQALTRHIIIVQNFAPHADLSANVRSPAWTR
jgi:hypothetical protein